MKILLAAALAALLAGAAASQTDQGGGGSSEAASSGTPLEGREKVRRPGPPPTKWRSPMLQSGDASPIILEDVESESDDDAVRVSSPTRRSEGP